MSDTELPTFQPLETINSDFNAQIFIIKSLISKMATVTLVQVVAVTSAGADAIAGTVDLQPLVNQIDPDFNGTPLAVIHQVPYFRLQGGTNAIIIDPQIGDIGIALFASRDISAVIHTKAQANPTCLRSYDMSDALYIGGVLNAQPVQYVQFTNTGITVTSPNAVTVNAPAINAVNGAGTALALLNNTLLTWLAVHTHTSAAPGSPTSPPLVTIPTTVATTVLKAQ